MLYFLYTGEIEFAPFSSDPRHELPARARAGDWNAWKLPSPSAKSIYRLADKVTGPARIWYPLLINFSTTYQPSRSWLWRTSSTTWSTATLWTKFFPAFLFRELPPCSNYPEMFIPAMQFSRDTVDPNFTSCLQDEG